MALKKRLSLAFLQEEFVGLQVKFFSKEAVSAEFGRVNFVEYLVAENLTNPDPGIGRV